MDHRGRSGGCSLHFTSFHLIFNTLLVHSFNGIVPDCKLGAEVMPGPHKDHSKWNRCGPGESNRAQIHALCEWGKQAGGQRALPGLNGFSCSDLTSRTTGRVKREYY